MRLVWSRLPCVERMSRDLTQLPRVRNPLFVAGPMGFGFELITGEPDGLRVRGSESVR